MNKQCSKCSKPALADRAMCQHHLTYYAEKQRQRYRSTGRPPGRPRKYAPVGDEREADFQQAVRELATLAGWQVFCTHDSRRSPEGEPDLRMVRPPRVVFAELKTGRGRVTDAQRQALSMLAQCPGVETYLWRPRDWDDIRAALERA